MNNLNITRVSTEIKVFASYTTKFPSDNDYKFKGIYSSNNSKKEKIHKKIILRSGSGFNTNKIFLSIKSNTEFVCGLSCIYKGSIKNIKLETKKKQILRKGQNGFIKEISYKLFPGLNDSQIKNKLELVKKNRRKKTQSLFDGKSFLIQNINQTNNFKKKNKEEKLRNIAKESTLKLFEVKKKKQKCFKEKKNRLNFFIERPKIWKIMKNILITGLEQRENVIEFYKYWIVIIYFFDIIWFLNRWKNLEKEKQNKIKKVILYINFRCWLLCLQWLGIIKKKL